MPSPKACRRNVAGSARPLRRESRRDAICWRSGGRSQGRLPRRLSTGSRANGSRRQSSGLRTAGLCATRYRLRKPLYGGGGHCPERETGRRSAPFPKPRATELGPGVHRVALLHLVAAEASGRRRRQTLLFELLHQLFFSGEELGTERIHIEAGGPRLSKHPFARLFLFPDMMFDFLGQYRHLGVVEFVIRLAGNQLGNHDLGAVVLDVGLAEKVLFHLSLTSRVEDLFLDGRVDRQLHANFVGQRLLALGALGLLELIEQFLDLAM